MTTTDNTTSLTTPATAEAASRYQRLRGHLAALKLHAAAEALPTVMDQATVLEAFGETHDGLVDGREAVTFLVRVKDVLEDPARLVLDL